jgi:hypothetical protein
LNLQAKLKSPLYAIPQKLHSFSAFGASILIAVKVQTSKHLLQPVYSSKSPSRAALIQFSTLRVAGEDRMRHTPSTAGVLFGIYGWKWAAWMHLILDEAMCDPNSSVYQHTLPIWVFNRRI